MDFFNVFPTHVLSLEFRHMRIRSDIMRSSDLYSSIEKKQDELKKKYIRHIGLT
jgi:hypothetical protein